MPLYESKENPREKLFELRKENFCAECGAPLNVYLDQESGRAFLACWNWHRSHHEGFQREARAPFEPNIPTWRRDMEEKYGKEKANKLMEYRGLATLSKEQALDLFELFWPEAPYKDRLKAAIICHQYGLNPLLDHLALYKFKKYNKNREVVGESWSVVQEIASTRIIAHRRHHYSYQDLSPRHMTDDEQVKVNGEIDESQVWAITLIKDLATGAEFSGVGSWPLDEEPYGKEKGNTKLNMAKIRSERQALDRAYPAELPQGVELIAENMLEGEFAEVTESPPDKTVKPGVGETAVPGGESAAQQWDKMVKTTEKQGGGAGKGADVPTTKGKTPEPASAPLAEVVHGEGFSIDLTWLNESLKTLNWSEVATRTFLVSHYKVDGKGTRDEMLQRLTREQAENFTKELNTRLGNQPKLM